MGTNAYITEQKNYMVELRRYFHRFPEIALHEFGTAAKIEEELDRMGIMHRRVGETGIAGFIRQNSGPAVALRADMDALPITEKTNTSYASRNTGIMHACGHDAHMASLLGAARILKERESELNGEIRLFFQQAEEIGQGARQFIAEGLLDGVDAILGTHVAPNLPTGTIALASGPTNASCDYFRITVHGSSAHVSTPQLGCDALYIAAKIAVDLQSIVARHTDPLDTVVVGVGVLKAGTAYNIIANEAVLEGTTRTFTNETRKQTNDAVTRIARLAATAHGGSADVRFESFAAPLVNDKKITERTQKIAKRFSQGKGVLTSIPKSLLSDDFADYLCVVPGTYAFIGSKNDASPSTANPLHHERFDIDEDCMLAAARLYVGFAISGLPEKG